MDKPLESKCPGDVLNGYPENLNNMDKPMEFKGKVVDGKLVIQPITKIKTYPDGRQDVTIHAPSLSVISAFNKQRQETTNSK